MVVLRNRRRHGRGLARNGKHGAPAHVRRFDVRSRVEALKPADASAGRPSLACPNIRMDSAYRCPLESASPLRANSPMPSPGEIVQSNKQARSDSKETTKGKRPPGGGSAYVCCSAMRNAHLLGSE